MWEILLLEPNAEHGWRPFLALTTLNDWFVNSKNNLFHWQNNTKPTFCMYSFGYGCQMQYTLNPYPSRRTLPKHLRMHMISAFQQRQFQKTKSNLTTFSEGQNTKPPRLWKYSPDQWPYNGWVQVQFYIFITTYNGCPSTILYFHHYKDPHLWRLWIPSHLLNSIIKHSQRKHTIMNVSHGKGSPHLLEILISPWWLWVISIMFHGWKIKLVKKSKKQL